MIHTLLLILGSSATAADFSVALEVAALPVTDPAGERFGAYGPIPTLGGRATVDLTPGVALFASGHHGRRGALFSTLENEGGSALYQTDATFGVQGSVKAGPYLRLTAAAGLTGHLALARFDSDPNDADSPVQIARTGFAPGGRAAVGAEVRVEESAIPTPILFYTDFGYDHSLVLGFGDFGDLRFRGVGVRAGVGARF